jgi:stage V sporulation protein B
MIIGGLVIKNSFYSAIITLSFFSILDRLLGFFFKIYLSRELGASALGVYQVALSFFMVLLTATTSGIPLIVSKMTARFVKAGDEKRKHGIVSASLVLGLAICPVVVGVVLIFFSPITSSFTDERSKTLLLALLPALFFSAVYSSFRGSLWGAKHYFFVSIVEIIEQITRIVFCVVLFVIGCDKLVSTAVSLPVGCFFSALSVAIIYFSKGGKLTSAKG